jgi:hypothetical protein
MAEHHGIAGTCNDDQVKIIYKVYVDWLIIYGFTYRWRILYGDVTIAGEGL